MSSGIKHQALCLRSAVRYHTMSVLRFALAETDSQAAKRVMTEIAGGQPRTSVPQLPLRRNVSPPGRGPLHGPGVRYLNDTMNYAYEADPIAAVVRAGLTKSGRDIQLFSSS
jgi:hypothetical protein